MLQLNNVKSGYSTGIINSNFQAIEDYLNNYVLNRDGVIPGEANQMEVDLDMNSQDILNVGKMNANRINLGGVPIKELLDNIVEEATQEANRAEQEADRAEQEADRAEAASGANNAYLLNRANHTGTQPINTVAGLTAELGSKVGTTDPRLSNPRTPTGTAGGVLSGTYPNPSFAVDMATQAELDAVASTKVDKVEGKGLSEEDFTTALKDKLESLSPTLGGIESIVAGSGIAVDDSDPANPVVSATGGGGGIDSIVAGSGINVDNTDPANPVISATVSAGTEVNVQTGTAYTLVLSDAFKMVTMDNAVANTITVPPNSAVAFPANTRIDLGQDGVGQTTIAAGAGVTIRTPETLKLRKQWSKASLIRRGADVWDLVGDLEVEA